MKICRECGELKLLSEFYKNKRSKDGYDYRCKACNKIHNQKQYQANKNQINIRTKEYYYENQDILLEKKKEYYENNTELIKSRVKTYSQTDAGKEVAKRTRQHRRGYGYEPLNARFDGAHFHHLHINDSNEGIYIPEDLHNFIYHNSITWQGMDEMNIVALLYLMSEELYGSS
jgi:hypothetical protein